MSLTYWFLKTPAFLIGVEDRSSYGRCFIRKDILKNFAKFTGKHLCQSLFCNKVAGLRSATLLKKDLDRGVFCVFCRIFKNTYFEEHLWTTAFVEDSFHQHEYVCLDLMRCVKVGLFRLNLFASFLFPPTDFHLTKNTELASLLWSYTRQM